MRRNLRIFQVDSFTDVAFRGNPAGVCILERSITDDLMQKIALEMNLSETVFAIIEESGKAVADTGRYDLRWFTPTVEVDLCGHATLAAAKVLFDEYRVKFDRLSFSTRSGELVVSRVGKKLCMDFPVDLTDSIAAPREILNALGLKEIIEAGRSRRMGLPLFEVSDPRMVVNLKPDFQKLVEFADDFGSAIVTARSIDDKCDFISRFFAPRFGINEDPVTGAAHTILGPYWAEKLGKKKLKAYQASSRGGEVELVVKGERIDLIGQAVVVMEGEIMIPSNHS